CSAVDLLIALMSFCDTSPPPAFGLLFARVEIRELLLQVSDFWRVIVDDVGIVGMMGGVVLVVGLGGIKGLQWDYLGHDGTRKNFGFFELRDVGLGDSLLLIVGIENGRSILVAGVGSLPVQLRGIVGDGEEHPKKLPVGDLRRIVSDLHRFRVAGVAVAYQFVFRRVGGASRVARGGPDYTLYMLENSLNAPEAATGDHGSLLRLGCCQFGIYGRIRDDDARAVAGIAGDCAHEDDHQDHSGYARGGTGHCQSHYELLRTARHFIASAH